MSFYVKLNCETCKARTIVDDEELSCIADAGDYLQYCCIACDETTQQQVVGNGTCAVASQQEIEREVGHKVAP